MYFVDTCIFTPIKWLLAFPCIKFNLSQGSYWKCVSMLGLSLQSCEIKIFSPLPNKSDYYFLIVPVAAGDSNLTQKFKSDWRSRHSSNGGSRTPKSRRRGFLAWRCLFSGRSDPPSIWSKVCHSDATGGDSILWPAFQISTIQTSSKRQETSDVDYVTLRL